MESKECEERIWRIQRQVCAEFGAPFVPSPYELTLGLSASVSLNVLPLNGLRHIPVFPTCGWYIYAGEALEERSDFFEPHHVRHIPDVCPDIVKFLGLPPGWRFLKAGAYEDVWFDASLLTE